MKAVEPLQPEPRSTLTGEIRSFWSRNVNAERIMGRDVSRHERGSEGYFLDLQEQRYRSHRHLLPWISSMQPGRTVLEIGCGVGLDSYVMARRGLQVTAADLTFVGVQTAKQRFEQGRRESWRKEQELLERCAPCPGESTRPKTRSG